MIFSLITKSRSILSFNQLRLSAIKMTDQTTAKKYSIDIGGMRIPYKAKEVIFTEKDLVCKEPIGQFKQWFEEACKTSGILEPNAMCLSTCTRDGVPSSRYVLLKSYGSDGFKFYTNYNSRKCQDLNENPRAALVFYWESLARQVRIEGCVEKLPAEESKEYFQSRPRESQLGAHVSKQSQPIANRDVLTNKKAELKLQYADESVPVPKPEIWGGFIVKHHAVEFWQGQTDRLHDRIRFRRLAPNETVDGILLHQGDDGWVYERLSP